MLLRRAAANASFRPQRTISRREEKKAQTEREKKELEQAQERVAKQYRAQHPQQGTALPAQAVQNDLEKSDVPKSAKQLPGAPAHPYAGRKASK